MMRRMVGGGILAFVLALSVAGTAGASGFQTFEFSAAHIGQATAGMTQTENAALIATLPAGMVRLNSDGASLLGITNYSPDYSAKNTLTSTNVKTEGGAINSPHAYYASNKRDWAWGIGLYFPYNVVIEWPYGWTFDQALVKEELVTQYLSFSGAYTVNDELSVGGSLIYISAMANLQREVDLGGPTADLELEVDATEIGYNGSVLWDNGNLAAGLNYSPGYTLSADGDVSIGPPAPPTLSGPAKAELDIPTTLEIGFSYRSGKTDADWLVELDLLQTSWSEFKEIKITLPSGPANIDKRWKDTLGIKLGGYFVVARSGDTSHKLRAGIYMDESPIPGDTLAPDVPDGEGRFEWAVGYGLKSGSLIVDAAYFVVDFDESKTNAANPLTVGGSPTTFDGEVTILAVSVGYNY